MTLDKESKDLRREIFLQTVLHHLKSGDVSTQEKALEMLKATVEMANIVAYYYQVEMAKLDEGE